jgi:hypothetical protein
MKLLMTVDDAIAAAERHGRLGAVARRGRASPCRRESSSNAAAPVIRTRWILLQPPEVLHAQNVYRKMAEKDYDTSA